MNTPQRLPNIVIVMTDQQQAGVSAREGFPLDTTPFLDALAGEGVWFNRAYTAAPVCAPARVSLLTGRFPSAHAVRENRGTQYARYSQDLFGLAREHGYATAMVGKNHSHLEPGRVDHWFSLMHAAGYTPKYDAAYAGLDTATQEGVDPADQRSTQERKFDRWMGALNHATSPTPTPFPVECQGPYRSVTDALDWLGGLGEQPFCLWLSFAEPHNPYQVPEPYFSMFPPETLPPTWAGAEVLADKGFKWEWTRRLGESTYPDYAEMLPRTRANYFGMLRLIDDQVRRFVGALKGRGLWANTLFVFLADHGDFAGEYGLIRKGPELPEVLTRIPMQVTGPCIAPLTAPHPAFVSIVDILPTLCEAIGAPLPAGVQGRSLWPLLTGAAYPADEFASVYAEQGYGGLHYTEDDNPDLSHCAIPGPVRATFDELNTYSQSGTLRMLRRCDADGDWKLVFDMQGAGQLYNLADDPRELRNLFGRPAFAAVQCRLLAELLAWTLRAQDPLPYPVQKYVIKTDPRNYYAPYRR